MKAKKVTAICGKRNRHPISSLRPMRHGRNGVLRRTSANGRTWDMMKEATVIPAMPGNGLWQWAKRNREAKAAMSQK